jgi:mRNA interferase HigB
MDITGKQILRDFADSHADARSQIESWEAIVESEFWNTPHDLKARYPKADTLKNRNAVFDICWNKYRLWVKVNYKNKTILIKKIGTHKEYDKWIII